MIWGGGAQGTEDPEFGKRWKFKNNLNNAGKIVLPWHLMMATLLIFHCARCIIDMTASFAI